MDFLFTLLGNVGVMCFLAAYFLLQKGALKADDYSYLLLNLAGALLLILSLLQDWNLAAFLLEAAWALISLYGLWKRWRHPPSATLHPRL